MVPPESVSVSDSECVPFLQWALPRLGLFWPGFRKVRRQVRKRLRSRLVELGLANLQAYRDYLERHPEEWPALDACCRISISRFYRDWSVFDRLRDQILPELAQAARRAGQQELHCWSAGCASGEEPSTLALIWRFCLSAKYPDLAFQVTATDVDEHLLGRAARGRYGRSSLEELPPAWLDAAFDRCGEEFCLKPEYRDPVRFLRQDIRHEFPPGTFHCVLCRNLVFTYFDASLQAEILKRLLQQLRPGGFLVLGRHETLPPGTTELSEYRPGSGLYRKPP